MCAALSAYIVEHGEVGNLSDVQLPAVAAVILDYHMPEMNGHEVASEINRIRPQTPIIMVSSDDQTPAHALQVDAFVSKDEAPRRLLPVITQICGESLSTPPESKRIIA
jgi:DNA-binding NarL/FixJ family response regulator